MTTFTLPERDMTEHLLSELSLHAHFLLQNVDRFEKKQATWQRVTKKSLNKDADRLYGMREIVRTVTGELPPNIAEAVRMALGRAKDVAGWTF
jgi:hypothetical protein